MNVPGKKANRSERLERVVVVTQTLREVLHVNIMDIVNQFTSKYTELHITYSHRMTPSFKPFWKFSPIDIPVKSSIQKRSSSSI